MLSCKLDQIIRVQHILPFKMKMHKHRFNELTYYISGQGTTNINRKVNSYEAGTFAFTRAGTPHNEVDPVACDIIWLLFDYEIEGITLKEGVFKDTDGSLLTAIKSLKNTFNSKSLYKQALTESKLSQVIVTAAIAQNLCGNISKSVDWQGILEYIDSNSQTDIDFELLARQHGYSHDRFRHLFKDKTGLSPNAYLIKQRIEHAKQLLKSTHMSLTDIAYDCGFNGSSQFSNTFKKHTGTTPNLYRTERSNIINL